MHWKNIANIFNLEYKESSGGDYRVKEDYLAEKMGAKKLGFHMEILEPKSFSCPYHFHHAEEEIFLVIEGKATLRQNGQFREIKKGDIIFFCTGPEGAHQFYNHTDQPFQFLAISTVNSLEVCEYPDSGKVASRAVKEVFEKNSAVDYLKGEESPKKYWPEDKL